MTKELPIFKTKSPVKAMADEKIAIAEMMLKITWKIVNRCKRLMSRDLDNLKRIRKIIYYGELFTDNNAVKNEKSDKKSMKKCIDSLTETI